MSSFYRLAPFLLNSSKIVHYIPPPLLRFIFINLSMLKFYRTLLTLFFPFAHFHFHPMDLDKISLCTKLQLPSQLPHSFWSWYSLYSHLLPCLINFYSYLSNKTTFIKINCHPYCQIGVLILRSSHSWLISSPQHVDH